MRAIVFVLFAGLVHAAGVRVEFNPTVPSVGPFPNDFLTTPDPQMKTGRRVALPLPAFRDPASFGIELLNQLDGFNVHTRISVRFSGPVNPHTLPGGIFYIWLDPAFPREFALAPPGTVTAANRVVWDPFTNTATAKPDDVLEQGRRYAVVVTGAVRDSAGDPVEADEGFRLCLEVAIGGEYCRDLSRAAAIASEALGGAPIVGGAIFTTASGADFLEKARINLDRTPAAFERRGVFPVLGLRDIAFLHQRATVGDLTEVRLPAPAALLAMAGIGRLAFGSYTSPSYLSPGGFILPYPTALPLPPAPGFERIHFHAFLPATAKPPGGYPVVITGHGLGDSRFGLPTLAAVNFAAEGFAVVAINAVGHGFGPRSRIRLETTAGDVNLDTPGRSRDLDGDGGIGGSEGCILIAPAPFGIRDCLRQTALDLMQLVRVIRAGVDLDGDGTPDLDPARISYIGQSLGAFYGTLFMAVEPNVLSATLNVGGGTAIETARTSPAFMPLLQAFLAERVPGLLDASGNVDEEHPARGEPVRILTRPASLMLQTMFEQLEWLESPGAPATYAHHLRWATLPEVPIKRVLFQVALGDQTVPNPSSSLLIRAAGGHHTTSLYRHDLARERFRALPENPHAFLAWFDTPFGMPIAQAGWRQALLFFMGRGDDVPDVNPIVRLLYGRDLFIVPTDLPETLGFR
jgi:hypothetical protein